MPRAHRHRTFQLCDAVVAAAIGLVGCTESGAPVARPSVEPPVAEPPPQQPAPQPVDQGLLDARAWLTAEISKYEYLDVKFEGEPVDLAPPATIDIESGNGHGGTLDLVRLSVAVDATRCERITWQAYRRDPSEPKGAVSRAEIPTASLRPILDGVRALSQAVVSARPRDGGSGSSNDFFVLVRVRRDDASNDRTWEFAGYMSTSAEVRYAATDAVVAKARDILDALPWKPVDAADYRHTHFPDAFARNRELFTKDFHWWVMERSVEALGWFGDRSTIPTVEWVRDHYGNFQDRQIAKIRHVLSEPGLYLDGPSREVPDK